MRFYRTTLLLVAGLAAAGCLSMTSPPATPPASCALHEGLAGTWKSSRSSQLGPSSMRFTFECDCTYHATAKTLFARIRESGQYRVEGGELVLTRAQGEPTRWPFELQDGGLVLQEHQDERHTYRKASSIDCSR